MLDFIKSGEIDFHKTFQSRKIYDGKNIIEKFKFNNAGTGMQ